MKATDRRRRRYAVSGAVAATAIFAVCVGLRISGRTASAAVDDIGELAAALVAVVLVVALLDNMALARRLEERVAERTARLLDREARFSALVQKSSDVVTVVDVDGTIRYQSPSMQRVLGHRVSDVEGSQFADLLHPDDVPRWRDALVQVRVEADGDVLVEWRMQSRGGGWRHIESLVSNLVAEPSIEGFVINSRDVSDRRALEQQLRDQAFHDPLTGLANRALFHDRLEHALARRERTDQPVSVLFLDLDDFKAINDGRGHVAGDNLLRKVGGRIRGAVRVVDTVARIGGDEFAVLLEPSGGDPVEVANRILEALDHSFDISDAELFVKASIGIAVTETGTETAVDLLRNADVAMYVAKGRGKGRCEVFAPEMHDAVISRLQLEGDLRRGIDHCEFVLHYQPIVRLDNEIVVGVEALVRWMHPERGLIPPGEFIPAAEATGLIVPLGAWLLRAACTEIREWQIRSQRPDLTLSVNLSVRQLADPDLVEVVHQALESSGLDPARLTLELTESALMEPSEETLAVLGDLKALGVSLSIDDFGTGYSSLSYLQRLPVDELKIDRCFVASADEHAEAKGLIRTIVGLAEEFGIKTVAEGIEKVTQLAEGRDDGCQLAQGFFLYRPVPGQDLGAILQSAPTPRSPAGAHA